MVYFSTKTYNFKKKSRLSWGFVVRLSFDASVGVTLLFVMAWFHFLFFSCYGIKVKGDYGL